MSSPNRAHLAWSPQPAAQHVIARLFNEALAECAEAEAFGGRLLGDTGIRLLDLVDHVVLSDDAPWADVEAAGWTRAGAGVWRNETGRFPALLDSGGTSVIWLRVESVDDFLRVHAPDVVPEGAPDGLLRRAVVFSGPNTAFGVIERNGYGGFELPPADPHEIRLARLHGQAFRARRREFEDVEAGLSHTEALVAAAVADLGPHRTCDLWLKAEREFWMRRCAAGRLQKARQDAAGVGWANIDHHTYDGSRRHYRRTIGILEMLGYELREMLYAGDLAGWGSQVLWQPVIGSTIFADVDLAPEELVLDFAHDELADLPRHRRAGLLSALLGESILEPGLNHVAGLYDWRALHAQLGAHGVRMMAPFSDTAYLYQELTVGDWGAVDPKRVDVLEAEGHIPPAEAEKLRLEGSIYTHFENIERNDGYKGFNRDGIDGVLRKLDPRAYHAATDAVS